MQISELITAIRNRISALPKHDNYKNVFFKAEAGVRLKALTSLLDQLSTSQEEADSQHLEGLCQLLSDMCDEVSVFDSAYFHQPNSNVTNAYLILAEELGRVLHKHPYELLFPHHDLTAVHHLKLHEFFIGENHKPIDVAAHLHNLYLHQQGLLSDTGQVGWEDNNLSFNDELRVQTHSVEAMLYYAALTGNELNLVVRQQHIENCKRAFESAMKANNCRLMLSYGEDARSAWISSFVNKIYTLNDLLTILTDYLNADEWDDFLKIISQTLRKNDTQGREQYLAFFSWVYENFNAYLQKDIKDKSNLAYRTFVNFMVSDDQHTKFDLALADERRYVLTRIAMNVNRRGRLVGFMVVFMPCHVWRDYIKLISNDVINFCIYNQALKISAMVAIDLVLDDINYFKKNNEKYNRAVLFYLAEVYLRYRHAQPEYNSTYGNSALAVKAFLSSYQNSLLKTVGENMPLPYSRSDKEKAAMVFQDFLMSGYQLNQLETYLQVLIQDGKITETIRGALLADDLGKLVAMAKKLSDPDYFHQQEISNAAAAVATQMLPMSVSSSMYRK